MDWIYVRIEHQNNIEKDVYFLQTPIYQKPPFFRSILAQKTPNVSRFDRIFVFLLFQRK